MSVIYGFHTVSAKVCITQGFTLCLDTLIDIHYSVWKTVEERLVFFFLLLHSLLKHITHVHIICLSFFKM